MGLGNFRVDFQVIDDCLRMWDFNFPIAYYLLFFKVLGGCCFCLSIDYTHEYVVNF